MPDQDFSISLSADISDLTAKLDEAKDKAEEMASGLQAAGEGGSEGIAQAGEGASEAGEAMGELKEKAEGLMEGLTHLTGGWKGLLNTIGAGAVAELMEKISESAMELGDSMRTTSAMLSVSADDARGFDEAMSSLGVNSKRGHDGDSTP